MQKRLVNLFCFLFFFKMKETCAYYQMCTLSYLCVSSGEALGRAKLCKSTYVQSTSREASLHVGEKEG